MASRVLEPDEVREILSELVRRLAERGQEGYVHVIGGAAIALINPDRVATEDVDGYIRLADASDVLLELEREYDLASGWFNWKAQGRQPPVAGPEMWHEVFRHGSVVLLAANTDVLLAMKLNAARAKDTEDIIWLLEVLGITEYEVAERVFEVHYPGDVLKVLPRSDCGTPSNRTGCEASEDWQPGHMAPRVTAATAIEPRGGSLFALGQANGPARNCLATVCSNRRRGGQQPRARFGRAHPQKMQVGSRSISASRSSTWWEGASRS